MQYRFMPMLLGFIPSILYVIFLAAPVHSTVYDGRSLDISLSTGVTHSQHFVKEKNGLAIIPLAPGRSWNNEWILSEPISLDDPFRLAREVYTVLTTTITGTEQTKVNFYERFSVNRKNWSTWHALTPKMIANGPQRYELNLQIPAYENEPYEGFIHEWLIQKYLEKIQKPLSLTQIIVSKDPQWFESHIPVIRYVQFLIDVPFPAYAITIDALHIDLSWGTNQPREDLWFDNDPPQLRRAMSREQSITHRSLNLTPTKSTVGEKSKGPLVRIIEDSRASNQRTCKFEIINGSTAPISMVQVGVGRSKEGGMLGELQFSPANWDGTGEPLGSDQSPTGWNESLLSVGSPSAKRYSMSWQPKSQNFEIQPEKTLQFVLPLNLQDQTPCDQLHWTVTLTDRPQS